MHNMNTLVQKAPKSILHYMSDLMITWFHCNLLTRDVR